MSLFNVPPGAELKALENLFACETKLLKHLPLKAGHYRVDLATNTIDGNNGEHGWRRDCPEVMACRMMESLQEKFGHDKAACISQCEQVDMLTTIVHIYIDGGHRARRRRGTARRCFISLWSIADVVQWVYVVAAWPVYTRIP